MWLTSPTRYVPKVLQDITLEDQRIQAMEIYEFLNTPIPYLPRLNEGEKMYAALVNVPKTYLV